MLPHGETDTRAMARRTIERAETLRPKAWRWVAAVLVALLLAGCSTVRGDANEVVIEHLAEYPGAAQLLADEHCAKYGKRAEHVQMGTTKSSFIWLRGKVSVFECRPRPAAPAPAKGTP